MLDNFLALRVLYLLVTPFIETKAYKLGIIDENGKELKKISELKTAEEKEAYSMLHRLVFRIKALLAKLPGGDSKLKNLAAAYFLVKEYHEYNFLDISDQELYEKLNELTEYFLVEETYELINALSVLEDAPANSTGALVSTDEPVIRPKQKKKIVKNVNNTSNFINF